MIRASGQSIIDRQGIPMQILLVAGLNIVLFTSKHTVTNFMSVLGGLYKTILYDTCSPRIDFCEFSRYRFRLDITGDAARGIIVSP